MAMDADTKVKVARKVERVLQKLDTLARIRVKGLTVEDATVIKEAFKPKLKSVFDHLDFLVATPEERAKRSKIKFSFDEKVAAAE